MSTAPCITGDRLAIRSRSGASGPCHDGLTHRFDPAGVKGLRHTPSATTLGPPLTRSQRPKGKHADP